MSEIELYEVTRGVWAAKNERQRSAVKYASAIFKGKIVCVYKVDKWHPAGTTRYAAGREIDLAKHANDWEFTGPVAPAEVLDKYIGQQVPRSYGQSIRYLNCK